ERLLQLNADALPQFLLVAAPVHPQELYQSIIGRGESFADLDSSGLTGAVRAEQSETFSAVHLQIKAVDGNDIGKGLSHTFEQQRWTEPLLEMRARSRRIALCGSRNCGDVCVAVRHR